MKEKLEAILQKVPKAIVTAILVFLAITALPWLLIAGGMLLSPNPPAPEITYGEFPFELVYEIDGETFTVKDTYVCEFDGFGMNEAQGKYRKWKGYIKGTGEGSILILRDGALSLHCSVGYPEYYMDDLDNPRTDSYTPKIYYVKWNLLGSSSGIDEKVIDPYNAKIISWKLSDPIENTYK